MALMKATKRSDTGTRRARRLRKTGLIPAVVYGHGQETQSITLDEHEVKLAILHGERVFEIDVEGVKENVLLKDLQYDTFGHQVLHLDLARVDLDERVEVSVRIVLKGTPAGATDGGVLQQRASDVMIECPVRSIPEQIEVVVSKMRIADRILMRDLSLPEGAKLLEGGEALVATVSTVAEEVEAAPEVAAVGEPEVIGEKKEAEEEAESSE